MQTWYSIIPKSPMLSIYIWIIFCIMPFFFIIQSFTLWQIILGIALILSYFLCHYFSFSARPGLKYMWISFQMLLNIAMTLVFGYVYLALFTAFFIGNIKQPVGFYIMYGLHIGFTVLSIVGGISFSLTYFYRKHRLLLLIC